MTWLSKKLRKMMGKKDETVKFDVEVDVPAVYDFLIRVDKDVREIRELTKTLLELHKEHKVVHQQEKHENMRKQILVFDKLMDSYQFFEDDADINGNRLKGLREHFLHTAKLHHKELYEKFKDEPTWLEDW